MGAWGGARSQASCSGAQLSQRLAAEGAKQRAPSGPGLGAASVWGPWSLSQQHPISDASGDLLRADSREPCLLRRGLMGAGRWWDPLS